MFIVRFNHDGATLRRFHVFDADHARALVWAGKQLGWTIRLQIPDGRIFGN